MQNMKRGSSWYLLLTLLLGCGSPEQERCPAELQQELSALPVDVMTGYIDGRSFRNKPVRFTNKGGLAIFEGDIILGETSAVRYPRTDAVVVSGDAYRWPGGVIPFAVDASLTDVKRVNEAIAHWEANTSIRLIPRTTESDYVYFRSGSGCSSSVGRIGGRQDIVLDTGCDRGSAIHEIGHAVGLWHEQSREDRDRFVTINFDNILSTYRHNFDQHITDGDDVGAYDYGSIMHYPANAFAIDATKKTITAPQPIGQRIGLSSGDIDAVSTMYLARNMVMDFSSGSATASFRNNVASRSLFDGWLDPTDWMVTGDFMKLGRAQVLYLNRQNRGDGRVMIADVGTGTGSVAVKYWENWGASALLDGWHDDGDLMLAGDFMGLGYAQVMFVNRQDGRDGRVQIVDFSSGTKVARYRESWGDSALLDGWMDADDIQLVGDFMGLGRDQLLLINRAGSGGRVMILDFSSGRAPATPRYLELWGASSLLDGWHDANDLQLVGDFMGLRRAQVLFINRAGSGGRVLIADFGSGRAPAAVRYWENWGASPLLDGWHDTDDWQVVGDFVGLGRSQVLFINRGGSGGRAMIADFGGGATPAKVRYWENWGKNSLVILDGWHDTLDRFFAGNFLGRGASQVLFVNRN